jgi:predicted HicB family RNase H-like nuclease
MSSDTVAYKGYTGSISVSIEDGCLHGRILFINDLITYESDTVPGLRQEFCAAVDEYIETCRELGVSPDKPCSGTFNVRVGPDLHRKAIVTATKKNKTLNEFIKEAVVVAVSDPGEIIKAFPEEL